MPMEIATLASAAINLLGPYLATGADEFAKTAGKAAAAKVGQLYQAVKDRLKKDESDDAGRTLARFEDAPDSPSRQAALENALAELMAKDASFAETVLQMVAASQVSGTGSVMTAIGSHIAQADRGSTATVNINRSEE